MLSRFIVGLGEAFRETGQALERTGMRLTNNYKFMDTVSRHRPVMKLGLARPAISKTSFIAPNAAVVGNVTLAENASVWYGSVVRGDLNSVTIGKNSNVQDQSVITTENGPVVIGEHCTIGHNSILKSCTLEDECLIGIGAVISEGCHVSTHSMVAAGSILAPNTTVPSHEVWMGKPAKFVRKVTDKEAASFKTQTDEYVECANLHAKNFDTINPEFRN